MWYIIEQGTRTADYFRLLFLQKRRVKKYLYPFLAEFENKNGAIEPALRRRITFYYPMGVTCMVAQNLALLRGYQLQPSEHKILLLVASLSPIYDDLTDNISWNTEDWQQYREELPLVPVGVGSKYLQHFALMHRLLKPLKQEPAYRLADEQLNQMAHWQHESRRQLKADISFADSLAIMEHKGGESVRLVRTFMHGEPSAAEWNVAFTLGAILQFGNDLFDTWKDHTEGIKTIVNTAATCKELSLLYRQLWEKLCNEVSETNVTASSQHLFLQRIALIHGRTGVALLRLQYLEEQHHWPLPLHSLQRHELIVDMELWFNIKIWWRNTEELISAKNNLT